MRSSVATAASVLLALNFAAAAEVEAAVKHSTNIPAQSLDSALESLAQTHHVQILYKSELVGQRRTAGAVGELTIDETLTRLLSGTGLTFRYLDDKAVTIVLSGGPSALKKSTSTLQPRSSTRVAQNDSGVTAGAASSSEETTSANDQQDGAGVVEEILVTARRKQENAQTVPISITAISQERLRENHITSINELQYFVPSMSASGFPRDAMNVNIRGQQAGTVTALPGTFLYLDEVPVPADTNGQLAAGGGLFFDIDSVQVLKGPQGTLFGRNSTGGAILLQSKRPTNEFGGYVQGTSGNYNDRELDAALNVPVVADQLLFRVAVNAQQQDGFTTVFDPAHPNGTDADDKKFVAGRATLTFRPTDRLQNDLIYQALSSENKGTPAILTEVNPTGRAATTFPTALDILAQQRALGIRTQVATGVAGFSGRDYSFITDILRYDLSDRITLRNIASYMNVKTEFSWDQDGTSLPILDAPINRRAIEYGQYTEELQLQGASFGDKLSWIVGGFLLRKDYGPFGVQEARVVGSASTASFAEKEFSTAAFAQGTYDLSSLVHGLKFTAGVRQTWDERGLKQSVNGGPYNRLDADFEAPTWTLGLDYQITPQVLVYLASRRGYRGGGYNTNVTDPALATYDPEYVTDVELGIKSDWEPAGMPARINAAVYQAEYTGIQAQQQVLSNGLLLTTVRNPGEARISGAEFEGSIAPLRGLQLGLNFNWLDFKYTHFDPGTPGVANFVQDTQINRPRYKYGLSARYKLPVDPGLGNISLLANWNWQDENGSLDPPLTGGVIDAFGLLNVGANWDEIGGRPWDMSLFMTNALNETYVTRVITSYRTLGFATAIYGEPRMYGIRLRYRFGAE